MQGIPFFHSRNKKYREIDPDEILLDSSNLPNLDSHQFEGKLEKPIPKLSLYITLSIFFIVLIVFITQSWNIQITQGDIYKEKSENNMLRPVPIFAGRGVLYDRNNNLIIWNAPDSDEIDISKELSTTSQDFIARRMYATTTGMAHILGYVQYPSKDKNGFYYREDFEGIDGVEKFFDKKLQGENGSRLIEVDAIGKIVSENIVRPPKQGESITLSIDSRVQSALYQNIRDIAERVGFTGGAGIIMDIKTGELLALTSYPEYSSQIISDRDDQIKIKELLNDKNLPFLDRAVDGLYVPGSIIKPYLAIGALNEKIIDPLKTVNYTGSISVPNPYDSTKINIFNDWKSLGFMDMRHALAMSSDVYFYAIGGGYKEYKGLGIANIEKYMRLFGFGSDIAPSFVSGKSGTIPSPEWKKKTFNEDWYLGNTYHTAIGQYGMQVTLVQVARAVGAIANNGKILTPNIEKSDIPIIENTINIDPSYFNIVREGMRLSVTEGTSKALNVPYVEVAGKSGTAELGVSKDKVNSWITGFFPYKNPHYAFVVMLEKGSVHNLIGAAAAMRQQLDWMQNNTPEYFE